MSVLCDRLKMRNPINSHRGLLTRAMQIIPFLFVKILYPCDILVEIERQHQENRAAHIDLLSGILMVGSTPSMIQINCFHNPYTQRPINRHIHFCISQQMSLQAGSLKNT